MISKEDLKELIKNKETIYELLSHGEIKEIKLNWDFRIGYDVDAHMECLKEHLYYYCDEDGDEIEEANEYYFDDLYKTIEEAEWHKEFGCIERTERLELPTWEDVSKDFIPLKVASGQYPVVGFLKYGVLYDVFVIVRLDKTIDIVIHLKNHC